MQHLMIHQMTLSVVVVALGKSPNDKQDIIIALIFLE